MYRQVLLHMSSTKLHSFHTVLYHLLYLIEGLQITYTSSGFQSFQVWRPFIKLKKYFMDPYLIWSINWKIYNKKAL